ncbi:glycerol-3-phosphate 1-O-acyltransferase PlsY [Spiroplasma taiwanense]|uniref:Glycerol-3-phosphate acyltransferase n=1 Tax=Spiroplasma taiwanense CT-1 TaxID=1276220 RepID=S5LXA4_9MOLU|nr:glycerol-3-phosphate 1-O-acyltransferase PlsY [Spiroplasma taiwanense]AGR41251.1 glycerol-3-phosphate acyltransferase PlsY [Spiroplasma taiwanense CT-1]
MYLGTVLASIIGYFIGSFSFSITIVKFKANKDVREFGSKNAGATNASRIIGKSWGVAIMLLDLTKILFTAVVAMLINLIPSDLFNQTSFIIPGIIALIGHCWPIYYKFKGGKAVSCFFGVLLISNLIIFALFFILFMILLFTTRKVSIASLSSAIIATALIWVPQISGGNQFIFSGYDFFYQVYENNFYAVWFNKFHDLSVDNKFYDSFITIDIVVTLALFLLLFRHRENIIRIFKGTEPAFLKSKKEKKKSEILKTNKEDIKMIN